MKYKNIPIPTNSEMRPKGISYSERKKVELKKTVVERMLKELTQYAKVDPPPVPEHWWGKEEEYFYWNYYLAT